MTNGANNRIVTATGTDAMNAETNLTFDGSTLAVTGGATFTANVALGDLDYILMGPTGEYQIYHDQANGVSVIKDVDAGGKINIEADTVQLTGTANINSAYTLPTSDGTTGQALTTNGSGALSFTTITGTTINNNADNRVITGSGTANTLNGESGLTYDGSTLAVTGVVTETSSIAYKENVKPLEFNDAIYNVNAVRYDFKDGSQKDEVGVIAEELYKVLPDLVTTKDGKPEAVKYTKMTMYLLEALKKQNQEIQLLKEKLNG
jgi:hypothetical protein